MKWFWFKCLTEEADYDDDFYHADDEEKIGRDGETLSDDVYCFGWVF